MNTCQNNVLNAININRYYGKSKIIEDINIELSKGEFVSILGASGVGKTTLFNILSGLDTPDTGDIYINQQLKTGISGNVSYMQQKDLLIQFKTIQDNMAIPLILKGYSKKDAITKALEYFSEFGLIGCEQKYPHQISGGMRQRAAFLRSYLYNSDIMLLDEPFSALDAITKHSLQNWYINTAKKHNTSTLFITHDIDDAISLSDRIYIIKGVPGKITAEISIDKKGMTNDVFHLSTDFLAYKKGILNTLM